MGSSLTPFQCKEAVAAQMLGALSREVRQGKGKLGEEVRPLCESDLEKPHG